MRLFTAAAALVMLLGGAGEARSWYPKKRLPKPIDSPIVRPKVREDHKPGKKARHPPEHVLRLGEASSTATA